jgi:hypothetical protein
MTAYQKAQSLVLTGTDEEIVAVLRALPARDVPACDVASWMRERGLWIETPRGSSGSLYDLYADTDDKVVQTGLDEWYASVLRGQAVTIRATRPDIAVRIAAIASLMAAALPDGPTLRDEFYQLCGGLPYADLTVEKYAAQRAESEARAAREAAYSRVVNRVNHVIAVSVAAKDSGATPEEIEAAAMTAWETWTDQPDEEPAI